MLLCRERRQHVGRIPGVVEGQRRGAVGHHHPRQRRQVAHHRLPERDQLVGEKRPAGEQQHRAAGDEDAANELALDRPVPEHSAWPRGSDELGRSQQLGADGQVRRLCGGDVHPQPNPFLSGHEPDGSAARRKTLACPRRSGLDGPAGSAKMWTNWSASTRPTNRM